MPLAANFLKYTPCVAVVGMVLAGSALAQEPAPLVPVTPDVRSSFEAVAADASVQEALAKIKADDAATLQLHIKLTEIEAPFFLEQKRAEYFLARIRERGLTDSYIDEEGNVIGIRKGKGDGPTMAIAAHLDTVFPPGTDVTVREKDGVYSAPGIADDTRSVAALLSLVDALNDADIETVGDIIFVGDVGEEGRGDLRGIKALFRDHPEIDSFISLDGTNPDRIVTGGTGSRRFEVHFDGPGGHSFGSFGLASATHAMGRAITKIAEVRTPKEPKTTFTVGTVTGGTSVNSIAAHAWFALDMRSNDKDELARLEAKIKALATIAVAEENARWADQKGGEITVEFRLIGDRPVGRTATDSPLVQVASLAIAATGGNVSGLSTSSTDANVPMSMGIPGVTMGGGGEAGGAHSPAEWYKPVDAYRGPQQGLLMVLALVGVDGVSDPVLEDRGE